MCLKETVKITVKCLSLFRRAVQRCGSIRFGHTSRGASFNEDGNAAGWTGSAANAYCGTEKPQSARGNI